MRAPISSRRRFLQAALGTTSLSIFPQFGFGLILEEERTAWYREAKFGMFIHWGPYSLASVEASWPIMTPEPGGITEAEYRALPQRFDPTKFDPMRGSTWRVQQVSSTWSSLRSTMMAS